MKTVSTYYDEEINDLHMSILMLEIFLFNLIRFV